MRKISLDLSVKNKTATKVLEKNARAIREGARIIINRGGMRSSKTTSLVDLFLTQSFTMEKEFFLVTRKALPSIKKSVLRDYRMSIDRLKLNTLFKYNKTENYYTNLQTGSEIHFMPCDDPQKIRGTNWKYIHMNEGNELSYEDYFQLFMRSPGTLFIDFNPSEVDTWINTEIEQKEKHTLIKSSFRDNIFLDKEIFDKIEALREKDPNYWQIYGLGEYGNIRNRVWKIWPTCTDREFDAIPNHDVFYAYDDGYVHPKVLLKFKYWKEVVYIQEVFFQSYVSVEKVLDELDNSNVNHSDPIYCDSAGAEAIAAFQDAGYNAVKANKRRVSIQGGSKTVGGLDYVRRFDIVMTDSSVNARKQCNKYKYQEDSRTGKAMDSPLKIDDDAPDCVRYGIVTHLNWVFA